MPAPTQASPIDIVTGDDQAVGTIRRGEALAQGANFRTAHVFITDGRGDLLLQRLARDRERHPCRWGSSVAAYLHAGETYEEAAIRRLHEELGLSLALDPVGKIQMRDMNSLKFVYLFLGRDGEPRIREPDHIGELTYRSTAEIARELTAEPDSFTPTFRRLYEAFADRLH